MAFIVLAAFLYCTCVLVGRGGSARESLMLSSTILGAFVLGSTEVLSLFSLVNPFAVFGAWALTLLISVAFTYSWGIKGFLQVFKSLQGFIKEAKVSSWLFAALCALFLLGTLVSALGYPVLNYDSLTYHLPRVFFWTQNESTQFFPTSETRQLFSGVFAEYAILHLRILSGNSDLFVNLVQWSAYGLSAVVISLISGVLGVSTKGQRASFLLALLMPMALLQASSTQNDLVCALWCLVAIFASLRLVDTTKRSKQLTYAVWFGVAIALAFQTKGTAYLVLIPFIAGTLILLFKRIKGVTAAKLVAVGFACFLALSGGWYIRNAIFLDGDILASKQPKMDKILVSSYRPDQMFSNAVRNISTEFAMPSDGLNARIVNAETDVLNRVGLDLNSPENKFSAGTHFYLDKHIANQDFASAPLTMTVVICSQTFLIIYLIRRKTSPKENRELAFYTVCAIGSLLMSFFLLAWNPWVNRLFLPAVLVNVPLVGVAWTIMIRSKNKLLGLAMKAVLVLMAFWALIVMLFNTTNPLLSPALIGARPATLWNTSRVDLERTFAIPSMGGLIQDAQSIFDIYGVEKVGVQEDGKNVPDIPLYQILNANQDKEFYYSGDSVRYFQNTQKPKLDAVVVFSNIESKPPSEIKSLEGGLVYTEVFQDMNCRVSIFVSDGKLR